MEAYQYTIESLDLWPRKGDFMTFFSIFLPFPGIFLTLLWFYPCIIIHISKIIFSFPHSIAEDELNYPSPYFDDGLQTQK